MSDTVRHLGLRGTVLGSDGTVHGVFIRQCLLCEPKVIIYQLISHRGQQLKDSTEVSLHYLRIVLQCVITGSLIRGGGGIFRQLQAQEGVSNRV